MKLDSEARYAKTHEWARWEDDDIVVGITHYAQDALSDIVYVELPEIGDSFERGEDFGVVESVKAASEVNAPVDGKVVAINEQLEDAPEMVNEDPFGKGWFIRIAPDDPEQFDDLLDGGEYEALVAEEED